MGRGLGAALALTLLAVAAFGGVVRNGFVNFDDNIYLTENPVVRRGLTLEGARWALTTTHSANWHPLTWLSHMLDVEFFGLSPAGHHAIGLALHAANALLLLALLSRLTGTLWPPALVAALFAVHPLHVESVAWASERKDLLATFFALLALLAWLRRLRRPRPGAAVAPALLYALALAAKPMPVTLPFLMLLLDWWPLGRWAPGPLRPDGAPPPPFGFLPPAPLWREKIPLFLLAAASAAVTFFAQAGAGAMVYGDRLPFVSRAANALVSLAAYLGKTILPTGLSPFYPLPPQGHPPAAVAAATVFLASATGCALWAARRRPWIGVGWLWYLGTLVPVIGLVQVGGQARADRYTYLPLAGLFVAAAWSVGVPLGSRSRIRTAAFALLAASTIPLVALTRAQVGRWHDTVTLFEHALRVTPGNWLAHTAFAKELVAQGESATAVAHYLEALRLRPGNPDIHNNLANALADLGRFKEAQVHLGEALRLDPRHAAALVNSGNLAAMRGEYAVAADCYRRSLQTDPGKGGTYYNLGLALLAGGDPQAALPELRKAARIDPLDPLASTALGDVLALLGRMDEAAEAYRGALAANPSFGPAREGLRQIGR